MIGQVKTYVRAAENLTWSANDYDKALREAARRMWRHIARNPGGEVLRAFGATQTAPADGVVVLPDDCLSLEEVQVPLGGAWRPVPHAIPSHGPFGLPVPECWTDDVEERKIRLVSVRAGTGFRFRYLQEPVFPFEDAGTFRSPDGAATATYPNIPELCDSACEHYAAALMSGEELRDEAPIGYHGQQYSAMLAMIAKSRAGRPVRKYIRRTR
jgi:hypothetical protein